MSKIELPTVTGANNLSTLNNNFQKIEDALNKEVAYRKGYVGEPNEMQSNLDMNGYRVLNAHIGTDPNDLTTKGYVDQEIEELRDYVDQEISQEHVYIDQQLATKYDKTGGPLAGNIQMQGNHISGLPNATELSEPATYAQLLAMETPGDSLLRQDLAASTGSSLVGFKQPGVGTVTTTVQRKLFETVSIEDFGAIGNGIADDALAFRAAVAYAKANGPLIVYVPKGNYRFTTADVIPSISSGCCVPMDGVSDLQIIGRAGANILIEAAPARVNAFTHYVSAESATAQQWSQRNTIKGLTFKYTRAVGFAGAFTGILMLGCEDSEVSNNKFDYTTALGGNFGTNGSGKNNKYLNNVFKGVATCFDMSHCEDCTFEGNRCIGSTNAVGAFAHFYDLNTVDDIRMETPFSQAISSGNLFTGNTVQGYPSAFSLRGIRDSWVVDNRIHSYQVSDSTVRNIISIYTENKEFDLVPSQHTRGIIVSRNVIYGINNTGGGQTRGIFINQFGGTYPVSDVTISHNIIHDMPNGVGISYDNTPRNWNVFGNVIDTSTVGTPYGRAGIALSVPSSTGISPEINVTDDVDLILRAGPTRFVRFGNTTASTDAPVTGYITIRDLAGVARKLAVIT